MFYDRKIMPLIEPIGLNTLHGVVCPLVTGNLGDV